MTYGAFTPREFASFERERRSRAPVAQAVLCAILLVSSASAGLWVFYAQPAADPPRIDARLAASPETVPPGRRVSARLDSARLDSVLLDPALTSGYGPVSFARSYPVRSRFEPSPSLAMIAPASAAVALPPIVTRQRQVATIDVPLPVPRPVFVIQADAQPPVDHSVARRTESTGRRSFFDRMFRPTPPPGVALAYAAPEDGGLGLFGAARRPSPDHWTAIYDISTHTVTLPDGTRLEAHSGLGAAKDNPGSVTEHMRGATPPNVYELEPRQGLFHGVAALRLNPVGGTTYGREGLLAHSYMLGPRGDSNGCVVFKDYRAFRQAYDNGEVKRLVVVARGD